MSQVLTDVCGWGGGGDQVGHRWTWEFGRCRVRGLPSRLAWSGNRQIASTRIPVEGIALQEVIIEVRAKKVSVKVEHFQYRRGKSRVKGVEVRLMKAKGG